MTAVAERTVRVHGTCGDFMNCRTDCIVSGPAGTGKSFAALLKLFILADELYPGMRGLILRKTRRSLTESGLVTWEEKVVPRGHPCLKGPKRTQRSVYYFPNGSTIAIGGMDEATKIRSSEYDVAYWQEAIEATLPEWEEVSGRMRNGVMPYQQIMGDTNPGPPSHWIKQQAGKSHTLFSSGHEDNPAIWDREAKAWTPKGSEYIARLDKLTGVRHKRLRHGLWVAAEGQVFEEWDPAIHLIPLFRPPMDWPRYLVIDFGYTNPFVCLWFAQDPDGRLYLYREIYRTQRLVEDHAKEIIRMSSGDPHDSTGAPAWRSVIADHDAEGRATLERYLKRGITPAVKEVEPGLQAVSARLRPAGDGRPRLFVCRDARQGIDHALREAGRPTCTAEEFESYIWDTKGGKIRETPVKENDHGMDSVRYLIYSLDGKPLLAKVAEPVHDNRYQGERLPRGTFLPANTAAKTIEKLK